MSEQIKKRATEISPQSRGAFNQIQEYYLDREGRVKLPKSVDQIRQRWLTAFTMTRGWMNKADIAARLQKLYGICMAQAYNDIKNSERLFEDYLNTESNVMKGVLLETYKTAMHKAIEEGNWDRVEMFGHRIEKLMGFDREEAKLPFDPDDLKPHKIIFVTDAEVIEKERNRIKQFQEEIDQEFQDYEEVE